MCDKMGNRCITGGADVRCSCAGQNDVFASTNDNEDGEDPGSANLAGLLGKAAKGGGKGNAKLKKAAKEMMEGFGVKEERRAKQVVGSAKQAAEMAVDAMQEKVSKARGRAAKKPMPIE